MLDKHGAVLFHERLLALLGRKAGVLVKQLLAGDKGQVRRQARVQGGEAAVQHGLRLQHGGVDARGGALEVGLVALCAGDDLFPVPLIDVDGVEVVGLLIAADGVHVRVEAAAGRVAVLAEGEALPLGQRLHHLDLHAGIVVAVEGHLALHAAEVVVEAGVPAHEQRRGHARQIERGGKLLLKAVLEYLDRLLRFQQRQFALVALGADVFHRRSSFFVQCPRQAREYGQLSHALCPFVKINARKRRTSIHAAAKMTAKAAM